MAEVGDVVEVEGALYKAEAAVSLCQGCAAKTAVCSAFPDCWTPRDKDIIWVKQEEPCDTA